MLTRMKSLKDKLGGTKVQEKKVEDYKKKKK